MCGLSLKVSFVHVCIVLGECPGECSGEYPGECPGECSGECSGECPGECSGESSGESSGECLGDCPRMYRTRQTSWGRGNMLVTNNVLFWRNIQKTLLLTWKANKLNGW